MALGHFGATQAARLGHLLRLAEQRGLFRVIMIHHPPVRGATSAHKRLYGIGLFQRIVRRHGVELVLHGHDHTFGHETVEGRDGPVPVLGIPSASAAASGRKPLAHYQLYSIAKAGKGWDVEVMVRGYDPASGRFAETRNYAL
jgi:3',5'-cyclic AMP phosphodiesterase CpdA